MYLQLFVKEMNILVSYYSRFSFSLSLLPSPFPSPSQKKKKDVSTQFLFHQNSQHLFFICYKTIFFNVWAIFI